MIGLGFGWEVLNSIDTDTEGDVESGDLDWDRVRERGRRRPKLPAQSPTAASLAPTWGRPSASSTTRTPATRAVRPRVVHVRPALPLRLQLVAPVAPPPPGRADAAHAPHAEARYKPVVPPPRSPDTELLPILPLRNSVVFPASVVPINVGRPRSVRLVEDLVGKSARVVGIVSQRDAEVDEPRFEDLYEVGTLARVVKVIRLGPQQLLGRAARPRRASGSASAGRSSRTCAPSPRASPRTWSATSSSTRSAPACARRCARCSASCRTSRGRRRASSTTCARAAPSPTSSRRTSRPSRRASPTSRRSSRRSSQGARPRRPRPSCSRQLELLRVKKEVSSMIADEGKAQREHILRQQMKTIKEELGEGGDDDEVEELRERSAWRSCPTRCRRWRKQAARAPRRRCSRSRPSTT